MRHHQSAFGVLYPFDELVINAFDLEEARDIIREDKSIVESGVSPDGGSLERYVGSYIVIWDGEEWLRYEG